MLVKLRDSLITARLVRQQKKIEAFLCGQTIALIIEERESLLRFKQKKNENKTKSTITNFNFNLFW